MFRYGDWVRPVFADDDGGQTDGLVVGVYRDGAVLVEWADGSRGRFEWVELLPA